MAFRIVVQIFCAGVLASTALMTARAQTTDPSAPSPDFEQRQRDMRLLNKTMNPRDATKNDTPKRRDPKVVMAEIAEDFTRIQVVNNDLGQAISGPTPLNLEFVIKSAVELKERSQRFSDNLGRPEPDKDSKPPKLEPLTDVEQLKHALADLDKLITEFVHNPLFTNASTRDAGSLIKARRELVEINTLSEHIRKNAEQLSKTVKQSP